MYLKGVIKFVIEKEKNVDWSKLYTRIYSLVVDSSKTSQIDVGEANTAVHAELCTFVEYIM